MPRLRSPWALGALALAAGTAGCISKPYWTPRLHHPEATSQTTPGPTAGAVKVHLQSGELALLRVWEADPATRHLSGTGTRYDAARQPVDSGRISIPFDSIALVETHQMDAARPLGLNGLAVWTIIMAPVTVACVADPKACFGSCPTFYVGADTDLPRAEGFSASFARALEARDVDALGPVSPQADRAFTVRMTNEALETHAVRTVRVLAAPRPAEGRTFATGDGRLIPTTRLTPAVRCAAPEGDCTTSLRTRDRSERVSVADSGDLAARETIELVFAPRADPVGVILAARQTLMSTFLFYQTMGYFGRDGGEWLAALERAGPAGGSPATAMADVLGGIEVLVGQGDAWVPAGVYAEAGPIATDVQIVPLPPRSAPADSIRVRLRLARGAWRLDWVALGQVGAPVPPVTLEPQAVLVAGRADTASLRLLRDTTTHLVTYPGDRYQILFDLPETPHGLELFLESRGYYYEWMRAEWLRETDPVLALRALHDPAGTLRILAPAFKRVEPRMEQLFWSSRFGRSP